MKRVNFLWVSLWTMLSFLLWANPNSYHIPGKDFNNYVVKILQSYPTDGTHQYYWPSGGGWAGNTRDLYYRGRLFAQGDPFQRCYCCGLTFEVFFRAYQSYCKDKAWPFIIKNFDRAMLRKFGSQWFGADGNRKTLQNAVVRNGLGVAISIQEAKKGDFVQFWRYSGSGHSVIFIRWVYNAHHNIVGLRYWSTQSSTHGIGYRTEYFGGKYGIDPDQIYIARIGSK